MASAAGQQTLTFAATACVKHGGGEDDPQADSSGGLALVIGFTCFPFSFLSFVVPPRPPPPSSPETLHCRAALV